MVNKKNKSPPEITPAGHENANTAYLLRNPSSVLSRRLLHLVQYLA